MMKETFHIPNISCGHCVSAIESELQDLSGVISVSGDPDAKQIEVQWEAPATVETIRKTLAGINYPAQ